MSRWEVKRVLVQSGVKDDKELLEETLEEGWEPFSAVRTEYGQDVYYFRRLKNISYGSAVALGTNTIASLPKKNLCTNPGCKTCLQDDPTSWTHFTDSLHNPSPICRCDFCKDDKMKQKERRCSCGDWADYSGKCGPNGCYNRPA